ncbi:MAG: zeta toxin family protein [Polyangiaceae bacterium]|nr:zeta toxin family protein [Polyangiaceae bacterium]
MKPVLLLICGPNGSGKTTITEKLRVEKWSEGVEYLNADEIARDRFGDWNSPTAVMQAAKWTVARREDLLSQGKGIALETVMSTEDKLDLIRRAKAAGYFVRLFFVSTKEPRINAARVAGRVMRGGHTVPIEKIISRYLRSMTNLSSAVELADRVYIYDNSVDDEEAVLYARVQDGLLRKIYAELPPWIGEVASSLSQHPEFVDARDQGLTTLFRPVGPKEMALIAESRFLRFPARLPEQPIFYPVCNEKYAIEIASRWNVKESGAGCVTRFRVKNEFLNRYEKQVVGARYHEEYWIPAEHLDEFNDAIVGPIEIIHTFL